MSKPLMLECAEL